VSIYFGEKVSDECIMRIGNQLTKHQVNIYKVLLEYDKEFKGKKINFINS